MSEFKACPSCGSQMYIRQITEEEVIEEDGKKVVVRSEPKTVYQCGRCAFKANLICG